MVTRRLFLASVSAATILLSMRSRAWVHGAPSLQFNVLPFGGGGYIKDILISPDGATRLLTTDVGGPSAWVFNSVSGNWDGVFTLSSLYSPFNVPGTSLSCTSLAVSATDPNTIYGTINSINNGAVLKSSDKGKTWADSGTRVSVINQAGPLYPSGPFFAVDPFDKTHAIVINYAGVAYQTSNSFGSLARITALDSALASSSVSGVTSSTIFSVGSVPSWVQTKPSVLSNVFAFDLSNEGAFLLSTQDIASATSTQVTLAAAVSSAVSTSDTIAFGIYGSVAFDPSTQGTVYYCPAYGGTGVWKSTDGGSTWSNIGGPTTCLRMECSSDGVLYVIELTPATSGSPQHVQRYQSGSWTIIYTNTTTNIIRAIAADPNNVGQVCMALDNGTEGAWSINYGATWSKFGNPIVKTATDYPWLATYINPEMGSLRFDPVVKGKLWVTGGFALWHVDNIIPANYVGDNVSWNMAGTSQTANNNELICTCIKKIPNGGPIFWGGEDISGFILTDENTAPTICLNRLSNWGFPISTSQCTDVDYAKDNSGLIITIGFNLVMKSTDGGRTWVQCTASPGNAQGGSLACQTGTNFVYFPANNGMPAVTNDGGTTWTNCLFDGIKLSQGWSFAFYLYRHYVCADFVNSNKYYALNYAMTNEAYAPPRALELGSGGLAYSANDSLTMSGGVGTAGKIIVDTVDGSGVILSAHIDPANPGYYSTPPTNPISVTGGTGSGAKFNLSQASVTATITFDGPTATFLLNVSATASGTLAPGQLINGGSLAPSTYIKRLRSAGVWELSTAPGTNSTPTTYTATFQQAGGIWYTTDGGSNWSQRFAVNSLSNGNANSYASLLAVPGYEGHLIYSSGFTNKFCAQRSIDGGATWHWINSTDPVSGAQDSQWGIGVAIGKSAAGASYPAIYLYGTNPDFPSSNVLLACDNMNASDPTIQPSWTLLSQTPWNTIDSIVAMGADPDVYRKLFVGFSASGGAYMKF